LKISRRTFVHGVTAVTLAHKAVSHKLFSESVPQVRLTGYVDPMVGTGGFGHCFPAAALPFGAVQLGPDTGDHDWDHCSGYHYKDDAILGFSHTHLSGTGIGDMQDFRVMPGYSSDHNNAAPEAAAFARTFSHAQEHAEPGYYRVKLDSGISAEMTATDRAGMHRYTFPNAGACLLLDLQNVWRLDKKIDGELGFVEWAEITVNGSRTRGGRSTNAWAKGRELYFTMECSVIPSKVEVFANGARVTDSQQPVRAARLYAVLHFDSQPNAQIELKVAISGVSVEGSAKNLATELPDWNFDHVREIADERWQHELSRAVVVEGGTPDTLRIFYTSFYHAMLAPTLFDDVDGRYRGMDGSLHTAPTGMHNYSTYSLWDTYRALHPMLTLVMPDRVPDLVSCIVRQSIESPRGVTVWPLQGKETGCMVGYHSAPVVAEALRKGFKGIDARAAYEAFRKRANFDDYRGLTAYRNYGYVPCDLQDESGSKTCDYAYDDWCVAAIADAAGHKEEAARLRTRSLSYRNLFDRESGFIRPRFADGHWAAPFNPKSITVTHKWRDYTEANAWQTTFLVQHDAEGLCALLGGPRGLEQKLDALFNQGSDMPAEMMPPDITGMVGQYCQGNEPSHHIAYYYNTAGAPAKTQGRIHQLMTDLYHAEPDAMAGNEDCGQMSAWYCMNAFGFYPIDPTSTDYEIGTPLFDRMRLRVENGNTLEIHAKRQSPQSIYVRSTTFNGRPVIDWKLHHAELAQGGRLEFELADESR